MNKKLDVQIATIQIMKALDPTFFIAIEDGLKETSHSDTVKASIRRATVEAATEISESNANNKNAKVKRVLSANKLQTQGLDLLSKGDKKNAQKFFDKANQEYPIYQTTTLPPSSNGFTNKDMKDIQKKMDKDLDKMMEQKMDNLEKSTGGKWQRIN